MSKAIAGEYPLPIDALSVEVSCDIGRVHLLDGPAARAIVEGHLQTATTHPVLAADIASFIEEHLEHGAAHVRAESFDEAVELVSNALAVARVFQETLARMQTAK